MEIPIPNRGTLIIDHVVLDFNGTLAVDGVVEESTVQLLETLSKEYRVILATADTFGTAGQFAERVGMTWQMVQGGADKEGLVRNLGGRVAAVGNGANDAPMFRAAELAIAILGAEGLSGLAMKEADIVVSSINRALELLLKPRRLVATLRV